MMKRIVSIALVVLMVAALFVGCGGSVSAEDVPGTYKVKTVNGKDLKDYFLESFEMESEDDLDSVLGLLGIDSLEDFMVFNLDADGSFTASAMGEDLEGTWKLDGSKVILTAEGEDQEATFKNGNLVIDMDGDEMVLSK